MGLCNYKDAPSYLVADPSTLLPDSYYSKYGNSFYFGDQASG